MKTAGGIDLVSCKEMKPAGKTISTLRTRFDELL